MPSHNAKLEITPLVKSDLPQLAKLYQQLLANEPSLPNMQEVLTRNQDNPNHLILAARLDGQLVGSLLAVSCDMLFGQCKSFLVVEDVVVDQSHRRQRVGTALMHAVEDYALQNNCSYIMLITDADRPAAKQFYQSLGYQSEKYCAFQKRLQKS